MSHKVVSNRPKWPFRIFFLQTSNLIWFTSNFFPGQKQCQQLYSSWILMKKSLLLYIVSKLLLTIFIVVEVPLLQYYFDCSRGTSTTIKIKITCLVNFSIFFSFFRKTLLWRICQLWLRIPKKLKILRTKVTAFFG